MSAETSDADEELDKLPTAQVYVQNLVRDWLRRKQVAPSSSIVLNIPQALVG